MKVLILAILLVSLPVVLSAQDENRVGIYLSPQITSYNTPVYRHLIIEKVELKPGAAAGLTGVFKLSDPASEVEFYADVIAGYSVYRLKWIENHNQSNIPTSFEWTSLELEYHTLQSAISLMVSYKNWFVSAGPGISVLTNGKTRYKYLQKDGRARDYDWRDRKEFETSLFLSVGIGREFWLSDKLSLPVRAEYSYIPEHAGGTWQFHNFGLRTSLLLSL